MNYKNIIIVLIFIVSFLSETTGQSLLLVNKKDYVNSKQESVTAYPKIKEALVLFEKESNYAGKSLALFMEAYQYNKTNPELNYNIGICHLLTDSKEKASYYLDNACELNPDVSKDLYYFRGLAYQYQSEFLKAIKMFNKNIEIAMRVREIKDPTFIELCEKRISECKSGITLQGSYSGKEVNSLNGVNSKNNDLNPIKNGDNFYFSVQQKGIQKDSTLEKVYSVSVNDERFGEHKREDVAFGENLNMAIVSSKGENEFVFYSGVDGGGDVFLAKKIDGKWMPDESLNFINEPSSREASACFSGNELYFVSDRNGGNGQCDIFYCTKDKDGKWSKPRNIGLDINTAFDETDVFISPDGKELYFSSEGHNTMGGYDIFKCDRLEFGGWSAPVNLGISVNSPYNEVQFFKSVDGEEYIASDRKGGLGGYDIYSLEEVVKPNVAKVEKQKDVKASAQQGNSPANNEVKKELVKKEEVPELSYRVQILACKNEASAGELYLNYKEKGVITHQLIEGWHKYTIGEFSSYREAANYKDSCGIISAFIVLFKNGQPIKLGDI